MLSKNKIIMVSALACSLLLGTVATTFASSKSGQSLNQSIESSKKETRVKWKGKAYLATGYWCNVTSSNNVFKESPKVTNHTSNPSEIKVRILNGRGALVGETKTIGVGETVQLDQIPAFSGTYTLQAYTEGMSDDYLISID